jgi:hypothetical protein
LDPTSFAFRFLIIAAMPFTLSSVNYLLIKIVKSEVEDRLHVDHAIAKGRDRIDGDEDCGLPRPTVFASGMLVK